MLAPGKTNSAIYLITVIHLMGTRSALRDKLVTPLLNGGRHV